MSERLTPEDKRALEQLLAEVEENPPTIGLVGVSGVGKSSTINTMFKTNLPISHTIACTKEFRKVPLELQATQGPARGKNLQLVVVDAPGLGEDLRRDPEYLQMYRENLPACDVILWIMTARNRAIALDQMYLEQFADLHERMVFGINQVDIVEPMNWKPGSPIPFDKQKQNIAEIVDDRSKRLSGFLGRQVEVVPYSNSRGYNLELLFTSLLQSCAKRRSWLFFALKNEDVDYRGWVPKEVLTNVGDAPDPQGRGTTQRQQRQYTADSGGSGRSTPHGQQRQTLAGSLGKLGRELGNFFSSPSPVPPPHLRDNFKEILGRDDFERRPLTKDELRLVESQIGQEKLKSTRRPPR